MLKSTTVDDSEMILELLNSPKWIVNIGDRNVHSLDDAKAYILEKMTPQLKRLGYSNYTLIRKSDNLKVGCCGLYDRKGLDGIDIGFALLPEYERQGYAFESANKLLKIANPEFGIAVVRAITTQANIQSQRLIMKLGLTFEKMIFIADDPEELMLYSLKLN